MKRRMHDSFRYAIWRWQDISHHGRLYLRKLYLVRCPLFQVALHFFHGPDPGRDLHDHPRDFVSILLRGAYVETRPELEHQRGGWRVDVDEEGDQCWNQHLRVSVRKAPSIAYRRAEAMHCIADVSPGAITLVLWGRKRREWGFGTRFGWINWRAYLMPWQ